MAPDLSVRELLGHDLDGWSAIVKASPQGSIYSLPEYMEILCTAAGGSFRVLGVWLGDELVGGVALYERRAHFRTYVAHRLLLFYNGPVLRRFDTRYQSVRTAREVRAMTAIADALRRGRYGSVALRCRSSITDVRPFLAAGWSAKPGYTYVVAIDDLDASWSRMEHNLRRLVQRCEKEGYTITDSSDFDSFYRLHAATMARRELASYLSGPAFRQYFELLRERNLCRLFNAQLSDGRVAATQLVLLGPGRVCHTVAAAAHPEFVPSGVNAFLRWKSFQAMRSLGYQGNDLTNAGLDEVSHFKSQLGGALEVCFLLSSPESATFRIARGTQVTYRRMRAAGAKLMRRAGLKH